MRRCEHCQEPFEPNPVGRPKRYCDRLECEDARLKIKERAYKARHPDRIAERQRSARRDPEKRRARAAVNNAIKEGRLVRGSCEVGVGCEGRIEAHHDDYGRPLEVRWLCAKHHGIEHRRRDAPAPVAA